MQAHYLVDNHAEEILKIKCGHLHDKNCEKCEIWYKIYELYVEYTNVENGLLIYYCWCRLQAHERDLKGI